jgi:hypothetical protein
MTTLEELEAIRARHDNMQRTKDFSVGFFTDDAFEDAHADRATLLRLLDAAREELTALKRSRALDDLVAISQEAGLYDDPPPTRAQGESS